MTARQGELLPKLPRKTRGQLMHVCDAGGGETKPIVQFECKKCKYQSSWYEVDSVTEAKRGLPCPRCNAPFLTGDALRKSLRGSECLTAEASVQGVTAEVALDRIVDIADRAAEQWLTTDEQSCPGHVAHSLDPKICAHCGVHIDELRPD